MCGHSSGNILAVRTYGHICWSYNEGFDFGDSIVNVMLIFAGGMDVI
jgi:hypothetical protein